MYLSCWMAPRDIPKGCNYADVIPDAIRHAKVFVILVSRHSQNSDQVCNELNLATSYKRTIFPVLLDDAPLQNDFHYHLSRKPMTDAKGRLVAAASELTTRIHEHLHDPTPVQDADATAMRLRALPLCWLLMVAACAVVIIAGASILTILRLISAETMLRVAVITLLVSIGLGLLIRTALFRRDNPFRRRFLKLLQKIQKL